VVSFVLDGKDRRKGIWLCLSLIHSTEVRRQMGLCMKERLICVADDRMIEMVLLSLYRLMFGWLV